MKIKLDENLPLSLKPALEKLRHDVETVSSEGLLGLPDMEVLEVATDERRLLFTADRDFEDAEKFPPGTHPGIVVFRPAKRDRANVVPYVVAFVRSTRLETLEGETYVVEPTRMRRL